VIIDNLDFVGVSVAPDKADAVAIVDTDAKHNSRSLAKF
jgi:hypothetical protein